MCQWTYIINALDIPVALHTVTIIWASTRGFAKNKSPDQPAHVHRLISTFVICLLESIISKLAPSEISLFYLVSVAKQTGLVRNPDQKVSLITAHIMLFASQNSPYVVCLQ